jgi:hypothetical protein
MATAVDLNLKRAADDVAAVDGDDSFKTLVVHVHMRRGMIPPVHLDDEPEEDRDRGYDSPLS